ncbi:MAG: hypothetical protein ABIA63_14650, partial [bacterium]
IVNEASARMGHAPIAMPGSIRLLRSIHRLVGDKEVATALFPGADMLSLALAFNPFYSFHPDVNPFFLPNNEIRARTTELSKLLADYGQAKAKNGFIGNTLLDKIGELGLPALFELKRMGASDPEVWVERRTRLFILSYRYSFHNKPTVQREALFSQKADPNNDPIESWMISNSTGIMYKGACNSDPMQALSQQSTVAGLIRSTARTGTHVVADMDISHSLGTDFSVIDTTSDTKPLAATKTAPFGHADGENNTFKVLIAQRV